MGTFKITIKATGAHGCFIRREGGDDNGPVLPGPCRSERCPDCQTRKLVSFLLANGYLDVEATFTTNPDATNPPGPTVVDLAQEWRAGHTQRPPEPDDGVKVVQFEKPEPPKAA